jgi:type IV pilus assembly protein PilY1
MHCMTTYHRSPVIIALFILMALASNGAGQDTTYIDTTYCCFPPFMWKTPTPNILLILDNSGSMADRGYTATSITQGTPDDTVRYYGYFNPDSNYRWQTNCFVSDPTGPYPGHILNWATMSRGDIAKRVLIGGKGPSTWGAASDPVRLISEGRSSWTKYYRSSVSPSTNYSTITVNHAGAFGQTTVAITQTGTGPLPALATQNVQVDIPRATWGGVMRQIADQNDDGKWDENAPRFGLMVFNLGTGGNWGGYNEGSGTFSNNGGRVSSYIGDKSYTDMYQAINNVTFVNWTPLGETYWEALRYFSQANPFYANANYTAGPLTQRDPYYDKSLPGPAGWGKMVPCRKSFILLISDGEPTMDLHVPNSVTDMPDASNLRSFAAYTGSGIPAGPGPAPVGQNGSNYLIHMAYYGNITDLRPDTVPDVAAWRNRNLPDLQNVSLFGIAAFESNPTLSNACKFGGFNDLNGNKRPDLQEEWDADGDGVPDTYFYAESGYELEEAMRRALLAMMARVSSASPVSVVSTGSKTGGQTTQSQFYQVRFFPTGEMIDWIGTAHSLWLDPYGLLREDTEADGVLNLQNDYVIEMISEPAGVTVVRYRDVDGNGQNLEWVGTVPIENLTPIWDGGKWLLNATAAGRSINAFVDLNKNGVVDAGEIVTFNPANASLLRQYLGVATDNAADTLIRYIRGQDFPAFRTRTVDGKVWKLGDIVNSGPVMVGPPLERYDFIYGDVSYAQYYRQYRDRRQVVLVGGNDGMLHCFNGGIVEQTGNPMIPQQLNPAGYDLGEELWAYIPYNLLPHLKWLTHPKYYYCHTYYVDLKAYVTDAQIFDPSDPRYPGGWGTILIGGMRLGGLPISIENDTCRSAFFAIDITDPLDPKPMWEFSPSDLGLTVCYSTVAKVEDRWFLVFGSGPANCAGEAIQNARIFVLDLRTGTELREMVVPDAGSFVTSIFACDWGIDYTVDRIYFGNTFYEGPPAKAWRGKIYRILTNDETDPNLWTMDMVMNMGLPVTAEGSVATDERNQLWVYFGSGRMFSEFDIADTLTRQLYVGFRDDTLHTTDPLQLYDVTNVVVDTLDQVHIPPGMTVTFDSLTTLVGNRLGWYRWLSTGGERVLTPSLVMGGAVLFTTFRPSADICAYGGTGYLYALYYLTGTAYTIPFLGTSGATNRVYVTLGPGMPSEPSLYVTADQTKVYIQIGGVIVSPETGIPGLPRGGVILWKGR